MLIICDHLSKVSYRFGIYNKLIKSHDENLYFKCEYPISSTYQLQTLIKKNVKLLSFIFLIFHEYQLMGILYLILHLEYRYYTLGQKAWKFSTSFLIRFSYKNLKISKMHSHALRFS